jgi:hypothetical protein
MSSSIAPVKSMLKPTRAWAVILSFAIFTLLGSLGLPSKVMNLAFPTGAFAVGGFLYFRYPLLYNGFCWWIWFLSAFVRRLVDHHGSFTEVSPILLAPLLAMGFTLVTVGRNLPETRIQGSFPFVLTMGAVIYGFLLRLVQKPGSDVLISLLDWLIPIAYGFHLFVNWREYPSYRQDLQHTFVWGVLVMGIYGIIQFATAPAWDMAWLTNSGMVTANGFQNKAGAGPFAIRVFSTMHSVEPFGSVLTGGLLLLFTFKGKLALPAAISGYLAFLFTMMRSGWIAWFAGLLILFSSLKAKLQIRLVITLALLFICVLPLATMEPFASDINSRMQTLSNVQEDGSAAGRQGDFQSYMEVLSTKFVGEGIARNSYDNTIVALLFYLGWLGTLPYLAGLFLITSKLFLSPKAAIDPFIGTARAVVVSCLVRILVNGLIFGPGCLMLWSFLGIGLAAIKYHHHYPKMEIEMLPQATSQSILSKNIHSLRP